MPDSNKSESDTCLYEISFSKWPIVLPPKISTFSPESPSIFQCTIAGPYAYGGITYKIRISHEKSTKLTTFGKSHRLD